MRQDNKVIVDTFAQKLKDAEFVFITGYKGMKEENINQLRGKLDAQKAEYRVIKNQLFKLIMVEANLTETKEKAASVLTGQNSFTIGGNDVVSVAKEIMEYSKQNEALEIKGGILDGRFITKNDVEALAALPSRQELLARVVGAIAAPLTGFVGVLSANLRNLVGVLAAIEEKKVNKK